MQPVLELQTRQRKRRVHRAVTSTNERDLGSLSTKWERAANARPRRDLVHVVENEHGAFRAASRPSKIRSSTTVSEQ